MSLGECSHSSVWERVVSMSGEIRTGVCIVRAEVHDDRILVTVISQGADPMHSPSHSRHFVDVPSAVDAVSGFLTGLVAGSGG
jgi:hypothetical protein